MGLLSSLAAYQYCKSYGIGIKKSIKGEHVYITGAGSGLGKIMSKKLALLGANITVTDIEQSSAVQTGIFVFK
jgi:D-arabinose 1-dehydrogenase-like Zn-dependent alcohol dehydrogenase